MMPNNMDRTTSISSTITAYHQPTKVSSSPSLSSSSSLSLSLPSNNDKKSIINKPGPYDVICARGKQAYNHPGNKYFRDMIAEMTDKYSKVESKLQRSMIVTEIVDTIRAKGNGFIRPMPANGKNAVEWVECSDVMCREKVGQHFRNALGNKYKSSTKSKRRLKEECIPKLVEDLSQLVLSNEKVKTTMERLSMDVIFIDEESEQDFLEKTLKANQRLLNIFKTDQTNLVDKFQRHYQVGQQLQMQQEEQKQQEDFDDVTTQERSRKRSKPNYPAKPNCGNARAA